MIWSVVIAGLIIIIVLSFVLRVSIKREFGREASEDAPTVKAYNSVNWIPAFTLVRHIIVKSLKQRHAAGWILDAGCGPGHLIYDMSAKIEGVKVVGLDINTDMLYLARRRIGELPTPSRPDLVRGDVLSLPLRDCSLDVIVSTLSLHHWPDTNQAFREFERVLRPGGFFLMLDLKRDIPLAMYAFIWIAQALSPARIRHGNPAIGSVQASYTAPELRDLLAPFRFERVEVNPHFGWLTAIGFKR